MVAHLVQHQLASVIVLDRQRECALGVAVNVVDNQISLIQIKAWRVLDVLQKCVASLQKVLAALELAQKRHGSGKWLQLCCYFLLFFLSKRFWQKIAIFSCASIWTFKVVYAFFSKCISTYFIITVIIIIIKII